MFAQWRATRLLSISLSQLSGCSCGLQAACAHEKARNRCLTLNSNLGYQHTSWYYYLHNQMELGTWLQPKFIDFTDCLKEPLKILAVCPRYLCSILMRKSRHKDTLNRSNWSCGISPFTLVFSVPARNSGFSFAEITSTLKTFSLLREICEVIVKWGVISWSLAFLAVNTRWPCGLFLLVVLKLNYEEAPVVFLMTINNITLGNFSRKFSSC